MLGSYNLINAANSKRTLPSDAGSVQDAARTAALEVLREVQQQGNLGSLGRNNSPAETRKQYTPSNAQASSANGVPKGYKGDPSDTRADAFRKMQVWLCLHLARICNLRVHIWSQHHAGFL